MQCIDRMNGWIGGIMFALLTVVLAGCGGLRHVTNNSTSAVVRDTSRALQFFVEGAMDDMRGEYDEAILQYEEAYRYDNAAPIAFAIAKDYYEQHKAPRAAQYADAAIAKDSLNPLYRSLRAHIALNLQMDFSEAERQYEAIMAIDSFDTQTLSDLATLYQFRGHPRRAAALYERLMDIMGYDGDVGLHLAQIYSDLGDRSRAVQVLKNCLREDPDDASLNEALASTYVGMHHRDSAIAIYRDMVDRYPDDETSRRTLADAYSASGNWADAFTQYKLICQDSTVEQDTINVVLGSLYSHIRKDSTSADSIFTVFANVANDDSTNWYPVALCAGVCLLKHDDAAAETWINETFRRTKDSASTLVFIAQLYLEFERFENVLRITGTEKFKDFRLYMLRAFALNRLHRAEEAESALYQSLEINPRNWLALGELGLYYETEKRYVNADSAYEAAIDLKPDYATVLNNFSYSLAERGEQLERARDMSRHALEQEPDNANFLDTYGWILYKMSAFDSAVVYLQRATGVANPSSAVIEHLGDVQFKRGERDEALRLWSHALELDDRNDALRDKIKNRSLVR